jgi:antitoxin Phd
MEETMGTVKDRPIAAAQELPVAHAELAGATTVSATEAQNEFGRVLDQASRNEVIVITRHSQPRAVLVSVERYKELVAAQAARLGELTAQFDALLGDMQSPDVKAGMARGFQTTPKQMGKAAVAAARGTVAGRGTLPSKG